MSTICRKILCLCIISGVASLAFMDSSATPSGKLLWSEAYNSGGYEAPRVIGANRYGAFAAGLIQTGSSLQDAYVRAYRPSGPLARWWDQYHNTGYEQAQDIAVDAAGVYIAGFTCSGDPCVATSKKHAGRSV